MNDSPPVFPFSVYNLQLDESTPPNSNAAVLILEAQDNDIGEHAYIAIILNNNDAVLVVVVFISLYSAIKTCHFGLLVYCI